jgi:hypothetical protein
MNRGHNGEAILAGDACKHAFLDMLAEKVSKYRVRLFAYCLVDNHYHRRQLYLNARRGTHYK